MTDFKLDAMMLLLFLKYRLNRIFYDIRRKLNDFALVHRFLCVFFFTFTSIEATARRVDSNICSILER